MREILPSRPRLTPSQSTVRNVWPDNAERQCDTVSGLSTTVTVGIQPLHRRAQCAPRPCSSWRLVQELALSPGIGKYMKQGGKHQEWDGERRGSFCLENEGGEEHDEQAMIDGHAES